MGALRSFTFSLLLCGLIRNTTCSCNVTDCFTDYISSLSCFCTGALPSSQYELLTRWDNYPWNSSCKLEPVESGSVARHWCVMSMEDLLTNQNYTVCVQKVSSEPEEEHTGCAYVSIAENIKPPPPFNLQLTSDKKGYNISWEMIYTEEDFLNDELEYEVRYKKEEQSWESQTKKHIEEDQRNIFLPLDKLEDCAMYVAEARAGPRISSGYSGSWSEWSLLVTWKTQCKGRLWYEIYAVMALVVLLAVGLSFGIRTKGLQKKLCCLIPSPEDFFKPLYVLHSGDFKSWVGPAYTFSGFDFAEKNMAVAVVNVQQDFQKKLYEIEEESSGKHSGEQGRSRDSKLYFSSGSVTNDQRDKSTGHVSIDTVTVSNEDGLCCPQYNEAEEQEAYRAGRGSGVSLDYPSAGDLDGSSSSEEDSLLGSRRGGVVISSGCLSVDQGRSHEAMNPMQSPTLGQLYHSNDWEPEPGNLYPQRDAESLSLDSFASNVRSEEEYGYPRIDLDTIDSGFVESDCSSPVESDFDSKGQVNCPILSDEDHSTNYVKQWVAYTAATSDEGCSSS
ncbi:interleukin-21 receptor-like [Acipenser oxyrinchus oxyrinchus]|uniref:Interleukin-21 receptor-like n=1 Tax=Acipenser oxyrinchus oxyrinchus TaxID=40147 RepID=A0AAD8D9F8_ACIOX|nr:interleukin-21 receptor-like [Acipenser oxyrinchus oxyrinchus]